MFLILLWDCHNVRGSLPLMEGPVRRIESTRGIVWLDRRQQLRLKSQGAQGCNGVGGNDEGLGTFEYEI